MTGFILAGGTGTRFKPITDTIPKALVPVCGESLLSRNLRKLDDAGIFSSIAINSHHFHEQIEIFQQNSTVSFQIFYEKELVMAGGTLHIARDFLSQDSAFMTANVDILHNFDIVELSDRFMQSGRICSLVSIPAEDSGTVLYDGKSDNYLDVVSKREFHQGASEADYTGLAFYRREFLDYVYADDTSVISIWRRVAQAGGDIGVIAPKNTTPWWMDIGTPESLAEIELLIENGKVSF